MATNRRRFQPADPTGSIRIASLMLLTVLLGFGGTLQTAMAQSLSPGEANCAAARAAFEATLPVPTPEPGRYVVQLVNEIARDAARRRQRRARRRSATDAGLAARRHLGPASERGADDRHPRGVGGNDPGGQRRPGFLGADRLPLQRRAQSGAVRDRRLRRRLRLQPEGADAAGPKSLAEWTFRDENGNAAPDISVVDGVNLTMDIVPLGPHSSTPVGPVNPAFWLGGANLPLSQCGQDLRATCPAAFELSRKDLTFFVSGDDGGDDVVGCFSNCGQYKFQGQLTGACPDGFRCAGEPPMSCAADPSADPTCYYWKTFCAAVPAGDPDNIYGRACSTDADCPQNGACWDRGTGSKKCEPRAFNKIGRLPARGLHQPVFAGPELPAAVRALQHRDHRDR